MKLFMLRVGEYSDAFVWGVFSTEENAEKAAATCIKDDPYQVIECMLDDLVSPVSSGLVPFSVYINWDGSIRSMNITPIDANELSEEYNSPKYAMRQDLHHYGRICCWAKDEKHAAKIAMEKAMQRKATEVV